MAFILQAHDRSRHGNADSLKAINGSCPGPHNHPFSEPPCPLAHKFGAGAGKLRFEYSGADFHVLNPGNRHVPMFQSDQTHARFLDRLTSETTMILRWIAKRLKMGAAGNLPPLLS